MNENGTTGSVENIENEVRIIFKWGFVIVGGLGILIAAFWAFFYSTYFANFPFTISIRGWYQKVFTQSEGIISKNLSGQFPAYTIQVLYSNGNTNYYKFWGKYQSYDPNSGLLYLLGYDNKRYSFKTSIEFATKSGFVKYPKNFYEPKYNLIILNNKQFTNQSLIQITWDDTRTLTQIVIDYNNDRDTPLNKNSTLSFSLNKIN